MKNHRQRLAAIALLLAGTCWLTGCGGGGGGGGDPVVSPPPAGGDLNPGLTGTFVHNPAGTQAYERVDARTGVTTAMLNLSAKPQLASATVSPDGSRYALWWPDSVTGVENSEFVTVEIYDSASKQRLFTFDFDGYAEKLRFSRDNAFLSMTFRSNFLASQTFSDGGLAIVDLRTEGQSRWSVKFINTGNATVLTHDWLPDNRYIYLRADRQLVTGNAAVVNGAEQITGAVSPPAGYLPNATLNASPDGTQLLVGLGWREEPLQKFDVWVANVNGNNLQRFSNGKLGEQASWSPDGKYIVMRTNAGSAHQGGGGVAYCERWYAPSTARDVNENGAGARPLLRVAPNGTTEKMPCTTPLAYGN